MESAQPPAPFRQAGVPPQRLVPGPAGPPPPAPRVRRLRLVLSVIGGMLALLCIGGAGIAYVAYDTVTQPDRSAPDVVVSNYLRAVFLDRDQVVAASFLCSSAPFLTDIESLLEEVRVREETFDVTVSVSWGGLAQKVIDENRQLVTTEITVAGSSMGQTTSRRNESWEFRVVFDRGWRICEAAKVS